MKCWRITVAAALVVTALAWASPVQAQIPEPSSVSELWTEVALRLQLPGKLSATFTHQLRYDESMSRKYLVAPEFSLKYELMDWWRLQAGYRHEYERDNDGVFQDRNRVFANTRFIADFRPAALELRLQWQEQFRQELDDGTPTRHILRTRLKAKLNRMPVVNPYASVEIYQRLDGLAEDIPAGTTQKLRFGFGVEWQRDPVEFNARYYLVSPAHDNRDPSRHVLSLGVRFDFSPWK